MKKYTTYISQVLVLVALSIVLIPKNAGAFSIHNYLQEKNFVDSKYFQASALGGSTAATSTDTVRTMPTTVTTTTSLSTTLTIDLSKGMKGKDVLTLQQFLKAKGYLSATPNGYFGLGTQAGVKKFQKENNITPNGRVGAKTRAAINNGSSVMATTGGNGGVIVITTIENNMCVFTQYPVMWIPGQAPDVVGEEKVIAKKPMVNNDCKNAYQPVADQTTGAISISAIKN